MSILDNEGHDPNGLGNRPQPTVADIPDERLIERAVKNCRAKSYRKGVKHPRWVAVMETFGLGSGYSAQLCRRFGVDPDENVRR